MTYVVPSCLLIAANSFMRSSIGVQKEEMCDQERQLERRHNATMADVTVYKSAIQAAGSSAMTEASAQYTLFVQVWSGTVWTDVEDAYIVHSCAWQVAGKQQRGGIDALEPQAEQEPSRSRTYLATCRGGSRMSDHCLYSLHCGQQCIEPISY